MTIEAAFPPKLAGLFEPHRYKAIYGGRGSAKSWSVARYLLIQAADHHERILCARELQLSMADSVLKLLADQIEALQLGRYFEVQKNGIKGPHGSEFLFRGLRSSSDEIKSMERLTKAWVEEAAGVSEESLEYLIPTVRAPGSEIIFTWNPHLVSDPVHNKFVVGTPPPDSWVCKMDHVDNKWFPEVLRAEMEHAYRTNPLKARWVWGGECIQSTKEALWAWENIDGFRWKPEAMPDLARVLVGVDPAVTAHAKSDETGIIVGGCTKGSPRHYAILADLSGRYSPDEWSRRALQACDTYNAGGIVYEVNQGGDMVTQTLKNTALAMGVPLPRLFPVRASKGKAVRAEPIAALYEQHMAHHVGHLPDLERQMLTWDPLDPRAKSPDRCFAAGTLVLTETGYRPIEQIVPGDFVLTRQGFRRVLASACTSTEAVVRDYTLSTGAVLRATTNHPMILTDGRVVELDALVWEDYLLTEEEVWLCAKRYGSTGQSSSVTRKVPGSIYGGIFGHPEAGSPCWAYSIGRCGVFITETFHRAWSYITEMGILSITPSKTWNYCRSLNTPGNMSSGRMMCSAPCGVCISPRLESPPRSGMVQRAGWHGTEYMGNQYGRGVLTTNIHARGAGSYSLRGVLGLFVSARVNAIRLFPAPGMWKRPNAPFAEQTSRAGSTAWVPCAARISVRGSSSVEITQPVFNLTVEGAHEYVVEGVLAHNCDAMVWLLHELSGGRAPMRLASGVVEGLTRFGRGLR